MATENSCTFIGNLTETPELRYTNQQKPVTTVKLGVNSKFGGAPVFPKYEVWGKDAEFICAHAQKGTLVYVTGSMNPPRKFTGNDGVERTDQSFTASSIQILSGGINFEQGEEQGAQSDISPKAATAPQAQAQAQAQGQASGQRKGFKTNGYSGSQNYSQGRGNSQRTAPSSGDDATLDDIF